MLSSSTLSRISNVILLLTTVCIIGLSCVALLSQAVRTAPNRSWNKNTKALLIGASYVFVLFSTVFFCARRRISMRRRLQQMSTTYQIISPGDVPDAVHEYITREQARMCLIAYDLLPKDTERDGWGRPGTPYSGMQFRSTLLNTVPSLDALAHIVVPSLPKLKPHGRILHHFRSILPLFQKDMDGLTPIHYYDAAIQLARNSFREPTEEEFEAGVRAADEIIKILDGYRMEMMLGSSSQLHLHNPPTSSAA